MRKINVLVVDDENNIVNLLKRVINDDYTVLTASDGKEAFQIIENHMIDIVITDIKMPNMNGLELLSRIKSFDNSILVILMTAFATLDSAIQAIRNGAFDYIRKPFDIHEVVAVIEKAKLTLINSNQYFDDDMHEEMLVTNSQVMQDLIKTVEKIAHSIATVNIHGETGVGKEIIARIIHNHSDRKNGPFIKVNCSALPETLLESELFGYEKGAFTGAFNKKLGRFELANNGTIFLDEIGDVSLLIQLKLLRVLQEKELERLGGTETIPLNIRIITATNKDLKTLVDTGSFREDLYYRLNVVPLFIPPLRKRIEDIPSLIHSFIKLSSIKHNRNGMTIDDEVVSKLQNYSWPGNVRELENIIERMIVISDRHHITMENLPENILHHKKNSTGSLESEKDTAEEAAIIKALKDHYGNITKAADALGISRRSLHRKINKYQINP